MSNVAVIGKQSPIYRGSPWKITVPSIIVVDGVEIDYTTTGSLQLQYRVKGSSDTPTRWNSGDGASRFESDVVDNYFLIPPTDAILGTAGDGDVTYWFELDYIDTDTNENPVGIEGEITVKDRSSGAPA